MSIEYHLHNGGCMSKNLILMFTLSASLLTVSCTKQRATSSRQADKSGAPQETQQSAPTESHTSSNTNTSSTIQNINTSEQQTSGEAVQWKFSSNSASAQGSAPVVSDQHDPKNQELQTKEYAHHRLWMEDSRLIVSDDHLTDKGISFKYQIQGNPLLASEDKDGNTEMQSILNGKFNVIVKIIHVDFQNQNEDRKVLATKIVHNIQVDKKSIAATVDFVLPETPKSGQLFLGLVLEPISFPYAIDSFQGLYSLGSYKNLTNGTWLKVHPLARQKNFNLNQYASRVVSEESINSTELERNYQTARVHLEHIKFDFPQKGKESAFRKEFIYRMIICPINGVDTDHFVARKFSYRIDNGELKSEVTDNTGCIYPVDSVEVDIYGCQKYINKKIELSNTDLGFKQSYDILVNPWHKIAMDARDVNDRSQITLTCDLKSPQKSAILIDRFTFTHENLDYQVQEDLNLMVKKTGSFAMDVKVDMLTDLESSYLPAQPIRSGFYYLRTLIVRNVGYDSNNTYIAHSEKPVAIKGGALNNVHLDFTTNDLRSLANNSTILVQVLPLKENSIQINSAGDPELKPEFANWQNAVDQQSQLVSPVFAGNITLNNRLNSMQLLAVDSNYFTPFLLGTMPGKTLGNDYITSIIEQGLKKRQQQLDFGKSQASPTAFAMNQGLQLMSLTDPDKSELLRKTLSLVEKDTFFHDMPDSSVEFNQEISRQTPIRNMNFEQQIFRSHRLNNTTEKALCYYFGYNVLTDYLATDKKNDWISDCLSAVKNQNSQFFQKENRVFVSEVSKNSKWLHSSPFSISVGNSISATYSASDSRSSNFNVSAKADIGKRFGDIFSIGVGTMVSLARSYSESRATSDSVSLAEQVNLFVYPTKIDIEYGQSETCSLVRVNPAYYSSKPNKWIFLKQKNLSQHLAPQMSESKMKQLLKSGILICQGRPEKKKSVKTETYYIMSQTVASDENPEAQADKTRPFFLTVRGENEYKRFSETVKMNMKSYDTGLTGANLHQGLNQSLMDWLGVLYQSGPSAPGQFIENP